MTSECRPQGSSIASALAPVLTAVLMLTWTVLEAQDERPPGNPGGTPGIRPPGNPGGTPGASKAPAKDAARPVTSSQVPAGSTTRGGGEDASGSARPGLAASRANFNTVEQIAGPDGLVSRDRFMRLMAERFDALDKQKNGALPVDDLRRMLGGVAAK
jgi:hypothetical protein